jgi:NAD(P)-dependent dehydrogenase (short-subunit alcohol dehydrogenase family)
MNMGKLEGNAALITGDNSGIGLATAKLFVHEGTEVFVTGRCQETLNTTVAEIGPRAVDVQGDVSNLKDLDRLVAAIRAKGIWWKMRAIVMGSPRPAFSTGNAHCARIRIRPALRPGRAF